MLVGREIKKQHELYNSGSTELVAVYGRCRVGKTYLIDEAFEGKISFRHSGLSPIDDRGATFKGTAMNDWSDFVRVITIDQLFS